MEQLERKFLSFKKGLYRTSLSRIICKSTKHINYDRDTPPRLILESRARGSSDLFLAGKVVMRRRWIRVGGVPPEGLTRGLAHISRSVVPSRGDNLNQRGYIIAWRHVITSWATAFQNPLIYSSHLVLALSRSSLAPSILTIMRTLEGEENLKGFHRIVWSTILSFSFDEIWSSIATL